MEDFPEGDRVTNPGPGVAALGGIGSEMFECSRGTVRAKATKLGGTGGRKSQRLIVPWKPGNSPERTRWREAGVEWCDRWRETCRRHRASRVCQRDNSG